MKLFLTILSCPSDFFAVDIAEGRLRVFMNYGTGTAVASPAVKVSDSNKHHVDITWDPEVSRRRS